MTRRNDGNEIMSRMAPPEASTSLVDYIAESLQEMILGGELRPDEAVNINAIAKQTSVSLVPVREALARLSATGLLRFVPNRGYRVSPRLDPSMRASLFQARELLELSAAPLAAANRTVVELKELKKLNTSMKTLKGTVPEEIHRFFRSNDQFHRKFLAMTKNPYLVKMFESLSFDLLMAREVAAPIDVPRLTEEHDEIIAAIEKREAEELQRLLASHIQSTL